MLTLLFGLFNTVVWIVFMVSAALVFIGLRLLKHILASILKALVVRGLQKPTPQRPLARGEGNDRV